jgi:trehalose 6-phosphate synthase
MRRIVAVSNRVQVPAEGQAAGGLAVGVLAALEEAGGMWFGWSGNQRSTVREEPNVERQGDISYVTLDLSEDEIEGYYNGFCNNTLWPLLHYLLGFLSFERPKFRTYLRVNTRFAEALAPRLEPSDLIWVHDFHLIPLASALRREGVTQPIGLFLHTPFPDYDLVRALPVHREILRAFCAYDVIGFQTDHDLRSFKQCLERSGIGSPGDADRRDGGKNSTPSLETLPIGVDVDQCQAAAQTNFRSRARPTIAQFGERTLMLGVDRLDYSKGLAQRFQAFERFLDRYPEIRRTLVFMQVAPPTRQGVRAYTEIREDLERLAGAINGRYADVDWLPIHYLNQAIPRDELMGVMRAAQIGLVTPVRDGMNLVAKEFVAAQDPDDPGVLILSELAGAADELTAAVLVNPYDADAVADAIHAASRMPLEERRARYEDMIAVLRKNSILSWRSRFIEALEAAASVAA